MALQTSIHFWCANPQVSRSSSVTVTPRDSSPSTQQFSLLSLPTCCIMELQAGSIFRNQRGILFWVGFGGEMATKSISGCPRPTFLGLDFPPWAFSAPSRLRLPFLCAFFLSFLARSSSFSGCFDHGIGGGWSRSFLPLCPALATRP